MRLRHAVVSFSLALCACANSTTPATDASSDADKLGPGTFTKYSFATDPLPHRDYYVYVPSALPSGPVPLVVYLHGCTQTATDAALGTLWNQKAEAEGFVVVYPEQQVDTVQNPEDGNGGHCWNWFLPENFNRGAGEPGTIAGITQTVMSQHAIDPARVFVAGASAGGAMTAILGATYPDLYAALGILAAPAYELDPTGAAAAQAMGSHARVMPVIAMQGTADVVVNFPLGATVVEQWLGTDDLVDDGAADNSVSRIPASMENHGVDASMLAGIGTFGELCLSGTTTPPCLAGALGLNDYPYSIQHYVDAKGNPLLDFWIIYGMNHAWIGGSRNGSWTDPHGPSATDAMWEFFKAHSRSSTP